MQERINIHFKMNINNNGDHQVIEFSDLGRRYRRNNKTFVKMKEPSMEFTDYNDLTLVCGNESITIIRTGRVSMNQTYIKNETTKGMYKNQYVTSEITAFTKDYKSDKDFIYLNYDMILDERIVGNYQMEIKIERRGDDYE